MKSSFSKILINDWSNKKSFSWVKNPKLPPILKLSIGISYFTNAFADLRTVPSPPRTITRSGNAADCRSSFLIDCYQNHFQSFLI